MSRLVLFALVACKHPPEPTEPTDTDTETPSPDRAVVGPSQPLHLESAQSDVVEWPIWGGRPRSRSRCRSACR